MPLFRLQRLTHHMQAERNECLLDFIELIPQRAHFYGPLIGRPLDALFAELAACSDGEHGVDHGLLCGRIEIRGPLPPVIDCSTQIHKMTIQIGMRHGGSQVADQGRSRATLGDQTLGRVISRIQINIGQVRNQPVRPTLTREPHLLAGHKLQRAMGAEMQHRIGGKIFA